MGILWLNGKKKKKKANPFTSERKEQVRHFGEWMLRKACAYMHAHAHTYNKDRL